MLPDRLPLPFTFVALALAMASCGGALRDADGVFAPVLEGRVAVRPGAQLPRITLTEEASGALLADAVASEDGAFRFAVSADVAGERVVLRVLQASETQALYRFALPSSRLVLPLAPAFSGAPELLSDADEVFARGWSGGGGARVALLQDALGRVRWEAVAGDDGRAAIPRAALGEEGLALVLARRHAIEADGTAVSLETRSAGVALDHSADAGAATSPDCLVDGVSGAGCAGEISFAQSLELVFDEPIAPTKALVRGWRGPAFALERFLGDGVWELVARVPNPAAYEQVALGAEAGALRFRVRLLEAGLARTDGVTFHEMP